MNPFFRAFAFQTTRKRIDEGQLNAVHMKVKPDDVSYFNLSSNMILSFSLNGQKYYFRECPPIASRNDYFARSIQRFFETLHHSGISKEEFGQDIPIRIDFSEDEIDSFRAYIEGKAAGHRFFKTLAKTDVLSNQIGFTIWKDQRYDSAFFSAFGFDDLPPSLTDIAVYFLWCMRSTASAYKNLNIVRGGKHAFFHAVRAKASKIVAEALNVGDLIADSQWCFLELEEGDALFGMVSPAVPGMRMCDCTVERNGRLQRDLINLNIIDILTFQTDHGPNNYNVWMDNSAQYRVCAFDNDNPNTFFPLPIISYPFSQCTPFIDKNGLVARPHVDQTMAANLENMSLQELKTKLKPYLNFIQIYSVVLRVKKLNRAIMKTQQKRAGFLLNDDWNENTANEEISGCYGTTYFVSAMKNSLGEEHR